MPSPDKEPLPELMSVIEARKKLMKVNENIVRTYESKLPEKDMRAVIDRLFAEKRRCIAIIESAGRD